MIARVLSVAGSDPSGGAGIQQDLRTFQAMGVWGMAVIAAVTVQDTTGVSAVHPVHAEIVAAQIEAVTNDIGIDAAKTGVLATAENVEAVASTLPRTAPLVVDPIVRASSGDDLATEGVVEAIRDRLVPIATVVTPNAFEAEALTGIVVDDRTSQIKAAAAIVALGARAALVTGGHLDGVDVLVEADGDVTELEGTLVEARNTHGTGCVLSAAIAAGLARAKDLQTVVREAKALVVTAIRRGLPLGGGPGPVYPG